MANTASDPDSSPQNDDEDASSSERPVEGAGTGNLDWEDETVTGEDGSWQEETVVEDETMSPAERRQLSMMAAPEPKRSPSEAGQTLAAIRVTRRATPARGEDGDEA